MEFIFSTQALIRHLWQHKTAVFLNRCLKCVIGYWHTVLGLKFSRRIGKEHNIRILETKLETERVNLLSCTMSSYLHMSCPWVKFYFFKLWCSLLLIFGFHFQDFDILKLLNLLQGWSKCIQWIINEYWLWEIH